MKIFIIILLIFILLYVILKQNEKFTNDLGQVEVTQEMRDSFILKILMIQSKKK